MKKGTNRHADAVNGAPPGASHPDAAAILPQRYAVGDVARVTRAPRIGKAAGAADPPKAEPKLDSFTAENRGRTRPGG
jgi:hypothetical protein